MTILSGEGLQTSPKFTGERWIPGASPKRVEADHLARYLFAAQYAKGKRVLDIACGVGYGSKILHESGAISVKGVDIDVSAVGYAQRYTGPTYEVGDILNLTGAYDLTVCFETIEHIADYHFALLNLSFVSRGMLIISSPSTDYVGKADNPFHFHEFTITELSDELIRVGFKVIGQYGQLGTPDLKPVTDTPRYFTLVCEK